MPDFAIPTAMDILGANEDDVGSNQITEGKPVGGGSVDEWTTILKNTRFLWASGNRRMLVVMAPYGENPQSYIFRTTSVAYVTAVGRALATMAEGRTALTFLVDFGTTAGTVTVKVSVYNAATDVLITSGTKATTSTHTQSTLTLSSITASEIYFIIEMKTTAGTATLWGIQAHEDPASLP